MEEEMNQKQRTTETLAQEGAATESSAMLSPTPTEEPKPMTTKFELGHTVITPAAFDQLHPDDMHSALLRHASGDWGECGPRDRRENEFSLDKPLRLLSVYRDRHGVKFWIITEADRSATTILLPEDY
jgi:hypothetical protein